MNILARVNVLNITVVHSKIYLYVLTKLTKKSSVKLRINLFIIYNLLGQWLIFKDCN